MLNTKEHIINDRRLPLKRYSVLLSNDFTVIKASDNLISLIANDLGFTGSDYSQFIVSEDREKFKIAILNTVERCEYRMQRADGSFIFADTIIHYEAGNKADSNYLLSIYDNTPYVSYMNSLIEYNERLRIVADNTSDIVFLIDQSTIIHANQKAINLLGYTLPEFYSMNPFTFIAEEDKERVEELALGLLDYSQNKVNFRSTLLTKSGERRYCDFNVRLVKFKGVPTAVIIAQDITDYQNALEQLTNAKQDAESANKIKSDFLAMMSHEIRTPMNGVIGMTSLLLNSQLTSEQRDYAETIQTSGDCLIKIINDILDFSKIESNKLILEETSFDLRSCIEDVYDLFSMQAIGKGLDLLYLIDSNVPGFVIGDLTRIKQILSNLISNAIKFTDHGEIFTSVELLSRPSEDSFELKIAIKDSGIGIVNEKLPYIFEAFTQADTSTTRKYGGTGLGLPISKRLVELMGGDLWAVSEQGVGSTFYFTVIFKEHKKGKPKTHVKGNLPQLNGHKVIVVDDNEINRQILKLQFESWGMIPVLAVSGHEALTILEQKVDFSMGVIDLQMPVMDGEELAREIKKTHKFPLMLLSSSGHSKPSFSELFESQLSKPVRYKEMFKEVIRIRTENHINTNHNISSSNIDQDLAQKFPLKILVAEDNLVNQKLVISLLSKMGYKVNAVLNGRDALEAVRNADYDIILMDIQMPEMTGLEATVRIKKEISIERQPLIIALTANAMVEDKETCIQAGMVDYMAKPINIITLQNMLIKWGNYISRN